MRRRFLLSAGVAIALPAAAGAQETRTGADVAVTGGYSNNPFAESGGGTGVGFVALDVTPYVTLKTQRSAFTLTGDAHLQEYSSRYPLTDSYRVSLDYHGRPSERLSTFAHLDLSSAVLGADDQYAVGSITNIGGNLGTTTTGATGAAGTTGTAGTTTGTTLPLPGTTTGPIVSDIGLLGTRSRRRSLYATAGGSDALSAHDTLSLSGFVDIARYSLFGDLSNYNGYGGTLGYARQLSSHLRVGVQGSASQYTYIRANDTTSVYSLQGTAAGDLSQYWTIDGALGVSFIDTDTTGTGSKASLSGSVELCRRGSLDTLCVDASRQARATGFNGAQYVTSAGGSWRRRLNERSSLTLDGAYLQEGGLTRLNGAQNEYLRFSATYDRRLRERLRALVSARYRKIFGGFAGQQADYGGQVGVSYQFGDRR